MEENLTYEAAYSELEQIYSQINNEQVSIDDLALKVRRAAVLISFCQNKLRNTEQEINNIISGMPGSQPNTNTPSPSSEDENSLPF
ncbi:MAG TPA: exodeoxyribonuclease VII small subunit [Sphingobacteriaceae bacterium]